MKKKIEKISSRSQYLKFFRIASFGIIRILHYHKLQLQSFSISSSHSESKHFRTLCLDLRGIFAPLFFFAFLAFSHSFHATKNLFFAHLSWHSRQSKLIDNCYQKWASKVPTSSSESFNSIIYNLINSEQLFHFFPPQLNERVHGHNFSPSCNVSFTATQQELFCFASFDVQAIKLAHNCT